MEPVGGSEELIILLSLLLFSTVFISENVP